MHGFPQQERKKLSFICNNSSDLNLAKGIVSRDFGGLQLILMDGAWVPDIPVPREVYIL